MLSLTTKRVEHRHPEVSTHQTTEVAHRHVQGKLCAIAHRNIIDHEQASGGCAADEVHFLPSWMYGQLRRSATRCDRVSILLTIVTSTPSGAREATIMNIGIERNLSCVHIHNIGRNVAVPNYWQANHAGAVANQHAYVVAYITRIGASTSSVSMKTLSDTPIKDRVRVSDRVII